MNLTARQLKQVVDSLPDPKTQMMIPQHIRRERISVPISNFNNNIMAMSSTLPEYEPITVLTFYLDYKTQDWILDNLNQFVNVVVTKKS